VAWYTGYPLQVDLFRQELAAVIGLHDFAAFSVPRHDGKSTECHVIRSEIQAEEAFLIVTLEANRFLHRMVRSIVGACFDVSRGILPPGLVQEIFAGSFHGERTWAPAHGLTLEKVRYSGYVY
jgi:tRNA pseudouridine38-40 synthase